MLNFYSEAYEIKLFLNIYFTQNTFSGLIYAVLYIPALHMLSIIDDWIIFIDLFSVNHIII